MTDQEETADDITRDIQRQLHRQRLERKSPQSRRLQDDYILCREDEEVDQTARSTGGIITVVNYTLTGKDKADTLFIGRVVEVGPGRSNPMRTLLEGGSLQNIKRDPVCVKPGQLLMMLEHNISYRITLVQRPHYVCSGRFVAGVLEEDFTVTPVQNYVLVQPDQERARRATIGKGILHLASMEVTTDDVRRHAGIQAEYGVVVSKGPGAWVDGTWLEPQCEIGDLVLFDKSHSTLPVLIKGKSYTLVPSTQVILADPEEVEEQAPREHREAPRVVVSGTMTTSPVLPAAS